MSSSPAGRIARDEAGAFIILWALLFVAMLSMVAIVVDLGQLRASRRTNQTVADIAAIAAGPDLAGSAGAAVVNIQQACQDAFASIKSNITDIAALTNADTLLPCSGLPSKTACDLLPTPILPSTARITVPPLTIELVYPVPNNLISDSRFTTGMVDGSPCERFMVKLTRAEKSFFGRVVGYSGSSPYARAVIQGSLGSTGKDIPAFVVLERERCQAIWTSGGGIVLVDKAANGQPGVISVDSHGQTTTDVTAPAEPSTPCSDTSNSSSSKVLWATATPSKTPSIRVKDGDPVGGVARPARINMYALHSDVTSSPGYVDRSAYCHTACGSGGPGIVPIPQSGEVISRAPIDAQYNTTVFPTLFQSPPWPTTSTGAVTAFRSHAADAQSQAPAIVSAVSANPGTYGYASAATISGGACTSTSGTITQDFVYIDCPSNGSNKGFESSGSVTFTGKDFVFSGQVNIKKGDILAFTAPREIVVQGKPGAQVGVNVAGKLQVNTGAPATTTPAPCSPNRDAAGAVRMVIQNGRFDSAGETSLCQTFVLIAGTAPGTFSTSSSSTLAKCSASLPCPADSATGSDSYLSIQGAIDWTAPNQLSTRQPQSASQPFEDLALWVESPKTSFIKSTASISTLGVFFVPNATIEFQGPSTLAPKAAQFFARRINISGGGIELQPSPNDSVETPSPGSYRLIR